MYYYVVCIISIPSSLLKSDIQIGSLQPLSPSIWEYALGGLNTFTVKSSDHGVEAFSLNEVELFPAIVSVLIAVLHKCLQVISCHNIKTFISNA